MSSRFAFFFLLLLPVGCSNDGPSLAVNFHPGIQACQGEISDNNDSTSGFGGGSNQGILWDSSISNLRLDQTGTPTNNSELDSSWGPEWNSLVALWHLDETGVTLTDSSGNNNTATASGGATTTPGVLLKAEHLDGVSGTIGVANPSHSLDFNCTSPVSVSSWIYNSNANSSLIVGDQDGGVSVPGWSVYVNAVGAGLISFQMANVYPTNWIMRVSALAITQNTWTHIGLTYDGSCTEAGINIYINGQLSNGASQGQASVTSPTVAISAPSIGSRPATGNSFFDGSLDEIGIWNKQLTPSEIQVIYSRQSAKYAGIFTSRVVSSGGLTPSWNTLSWVTTHPFYKELPENAVSESTHSYISLVNSSLMNNNVALWHLDEGFGTNGPNSVIDHSGNGNNGTPTNVTFGANGKLNSSASFNGVSSIINVPLATNYTGYTIAMWVQPTSSGSQCMTVSTDASGPTSAYSHELGVNSAGNFIHYTYDQSNPAVSNTVVSTTNVVPGNWYHLTATVSDGGNMYLYVNGISEGTPLPITTTWKSATQIYLGSSCESATPPSAVTLGYYTGFMDEVGYWNRALSASEVYDLYRRGANRLKFQIKTCKDSSCGTGGSWLGPDGTNQTYFSELYDTVSNSLGGAVLPTGASISYSNLGLAVPQNAYLQYRTIFESEDSSTHCLYNGSSTWCSPELTSVGSTCSE